MVAHQELRQWIERHRVLSNSDDRELFFKTLLHKLEEKDENDIQEGLAALLAAVRSARTQAEKQPAHVVSFQIFPKSPEESELIRQLLDRLAIPFKMSA
ncbi:MAG: hypothetical protein JNJ90_07325 [Saprospiraceae bacterium]|jgi:hypothetical protein|nr:hypothetical protein [Saprospiraceae bacterium]